MSLQDISINKVVLIGRLSKEPELRHIASGTAICQLRVVTTESYVNREGNPVERRASHTVVVWGQKGEAIANQVHTNTRVFVEGRIQNRSYENQHGETKWITEIVASNAFALEQGGGNYGQPAPSGAYGQQQSGGYGQPSGGYTQPPPSAPPQQQPGGASYVPEQPPPVQQPPTAPPATTDSSPPTTIVPDDDLPF